MYQRTGGEISLDDLRPRPPGSAEGRDKKLLELNLTWGALNQWRQYPITADQFREFGRGYDTFVHEGMAVYPSKLIDLLETAKEKHPEYFLPKDEKACA